MSGRTDDGDGIRGTTVSSSHSDYMLTVDTVVAIIRSLLPLADEITEARNVNERMQALAPILEPTASQRGGADNLREQRVVLDAVAECIARVRTLEPV